MSRWSILLVAAAAATARADISASRTIHSVASGYSVRLDIADGCKSSDDYGSNDCNFSWGSTLNGTAKATFPAAGLVAGTKVNLKVKMDGIVNFDHSCDICGPPCTLTIPVVKKTVTIKVPPCPIAGGSQTFSVVLPSKSPIGILGVSAKGTVTVTDPKGAVLISADVNGSINDKMTAGDTSAVDDADEWVWDLSEAFSGDSAEPAKQPLFALRGAAAATAACGNDADHTLWEQSKASFQADMTACGKKCLGASACVKSCIKGKHAYSDGCAGCFGALAGCTKSYCMVKCINGNSPACTSCVKTNCDGSFTICSGISDLPPTEIAVSDIDLKPTVEVSMMMMAPTEA